MIMKKTLAIVCLLLTTLAVNAQWSQKIVAADAEKGTRATSMITYEDSIGYFYFTKIASDISTSMKE